MRLINNPVHDTNVETTEQNPRTRNTIKTVIYWTSKNGADDWTWGSGTIPISEVRTQDLSNDHQQAGGHRRRVDVVLLQGESQFSGSASSSSTVRAFQQGTPFPGDKAGICAI